jgi:putative hydrolase of the HAD superfamily
MIEAVTFDFWGTLVDLRHSNRERRAKALAAQLHGVSCAAIDEAYEACWQSFLAHLEAGLGLAPATLLSETLDKLGVTLPPDRYAAVLSQWQHAILDDPPPFLPGALEVLRFLRRRRLMIGLISDTGASPGRVLREFLSRSGARALFDWLTFSDETGVSKRCPQAFHLTLRALGVAPGRALHVGDTPSTDIDGAHAAGMRAALVLECSQQWRGIPAADLVLPRLGDLPQALTSLGW